MKCKKCKGCNTILTERQQKDKRTKFCNSKCRIKWFVDQLYTKCKCGNRKVKTSKRCRKCHAKRGKGQLARAENSWNGEKGLFLI